MSKDDDSREGLFKPVDAADQIEIRKYLREGYGREGRRKLENWLEGAKLFSNQVHETRKLALQSSVEYGKIFVRMAVLLNGGAMIALLAFTSSLFGKSSDTTVAITFASQLSSAFILYAGGLASAAICAAIGYLNWAWVYASHLSEGHMFRLVAAGNAFDGTDLEKEQAEFDKNDWKVDVSYRAGVGFGVLSLGLFCWGCFKVASAFTVLGVLVR